jgi:hypothetical protein
MRQLLAASVGLCLVLGLTVSAALALGRSQAVPISITRLHLNDCLPPCWIGIIPGTTTVADAKAKLLEVYFGKEHLTFKDSGFDSGPIDRTAVENMIEGEDFYLFVRMNISELVDGNSETVQSIALLTSAENHGEHVPTVADILSTFGAPQGVMVEDLLTRGSEVTLRYTGMDVVFRTASNRVEFTETPQLFMGSGALPDTSGEYRLWKGIGTLSLAR